MPDDLILPILRNDGSLSDDSGALVAATMFYPNDEERRRQLTDFSVKDAFIKDRSTPPQDILERTHTGPSMREFMSETGRLSSPGEIAGEVLFLIRQLDVYQPNDASLRKTMYIISKRRRELHKAKIKATASLSGIDDAWRQFKPVCHFWAAHQIFGRDERMLLKANLPKFLSTAERMRRFAEEHYLPPKTAYTKPLAAKSELWRAPGRMQLPPVEQDVPPLAASDLRFLASYKAKRKSKK